MIRMDRHSVNGEAASQTEKTEKNHGDKTSKKPIYHSKPRIFMSAGVLDDVYLLENQADGRSWLEKYGCKVDFEAMESPKKVKRPLSKTLSEPSDISR
eukprot:g27606.t1